MMQPVRELLLLRVFVGEEDRCRGEPLCRAILVAAYEAGLAGATLMRCPAGYGRSKIVRNPLNVEGAQGFPTVVEIVDAPDRIDAFLPILDPMMGEGLVTLEGVRAIVVGGPRRAPPAPVPASEEEAMEVPHEAVLLRIFTSIDDRYEAEPLYQAIVERARARKLAGATVLRGALGFGQSAQMREAHALRLRDDRPVVVEIVDAEAKIEAFLPELDGMMESGLVTLEKARVVQYGRTRTGYLKQVFERLGRLWQHGPAGTGG